MFRLPEIAQLSISYQTRDGTFTESPIAPGPDKAPMLEGRFKRRVAGGSGYVWVNRTFYAEFTGYRTLDNESLSVLGVGPGPQIDGIAPYWRFAMEKTWDQNSFMLGTFGMMANVWPSDTGGPTDKFTDIGADTQYQHLGETHGFSLRARYIWEHQKLDATLAADGADKSSQDLRRFAASASYIYNRALSVTGGYFNLQGTTDSKLNAHTGSPNSNGWTAEISYTPFNDGGPAWWPWLNGRVGVLYTHFNKLDGASTNYNGDGRNAKDNDTVYVYSWVAF